MSISRIVIASLAVATLLLGGCTGTVTIKPTDISSLQEGETRENVERILGDPVEVKQSQDLMLALYGYDRGGSSSYDLSDIFIGCGGNACLLGLILLPVILPVGHAISGGNERDKLSKMQRGHLCVAYREDQSVAWYAPVYTGQCRSMAQADAQYRVAMLAEKGKRRAWLCRAAGRGHPLAAAQLGLAYKLGLDGVEKDAIEAYKWFSLAVSNGYASADMNKLSNEMTPAEIAAAERLVREWKPDPSSCDLEVDQAAGSG